MQYYNDKKELGDNLFFKILIFLVFFDFVLT